MRWAFLAILLSMGVWRVARAEETAAAPDDVATLRQRVQALEERLQALETPAEPAALDPELAAAVAADAAKPGAAQPVAAAQPFFAAMPTLNPSLSFILTTGSAWHSRPEHTRQGGHAMDDSGFYLQGLELVAKATVDPYFRFDLSFQLTEAEVEEAYLTTLALPYGLQAKAGLLMAAFGRENARHLHAWSLANPSLMHTRFLAEEHFGGPGVELAALLPLPWYFNIVATVLGPNQDLGFKSTSFALGEQEPLGHINGAEELVYVVRAENFWELSHDWSLLLGLNSAFGQSPYRPRGRAYVYGADLYLKWRPISSGAGDYALALTAEYIVRDSETEIGRYVDHGGYVQLEALLGKEWLLALRCDTADNGFGESPDPSVLTVWQRRMSAAVAFLPTHFSKLRLQGDLGRTPLHDEWEAAIFLQAEISAGEHGAHVF